MIDSGCYGQVCTSWFAPQFPTVSSSNVEAVAANSEALQHYRQKVVYGHVTTNWWQTCIDTDHLGRHERAETSPEHICTETSGSYDNFQPRLRSHHFQERDSELDSARLSFLPVSHPGKWKSSSQSEVMAGENVSNDVDEEVYVGDGVEGQEAQEASAGDRRAIADADPAGQLDIPGETRAARAFRISEPPTDAARMMHNTTHVPFRDWYPFCVASGGRSSPHRRVVVNKTADTLPKFQAD